MQVRTARCRFPQRPPVPLFACVRRRKCAGTCCQRKRLPSFSYPEPRVRAACRCRAGRSPRATTEPRQRMPVTSPTAVGEADFVGCAAPQFGATRTAAPPERFAELLRAVLPETEPGLKNVSIQLPVYTARNPRYMSPEETSVARHASAADAVLLVNCVAAAIRSAGAWVHCLPRAGRVANARAAGVECGEIFDRFASGGQLQLNGLKRVRAPGCARGVALTGVRAADARTEPHGAGRARHRAALPHGRRGRQGCHQQGGVCARIPPSVGSPSSSSSEQARTSRRRATRERLGRVAVNPSTISYQPQIGCWSNCQRKTQRAREGVTLAGPLAS
jgi:hypothetical protein